MTSIREIIDDQTRVQAAISEGALSPYSFCPEKAGYRPCQAVLDGVAGDMLDFMNSLPDVLADEMGLGLLPKVRLGPSRRRS